MSGELHDPNHMVSPSVAAHSSPSHLISINCQMCSGSHHYSGNPKGLKVPPGAGTGSDLS